MKNTTRCTGILIALIFGLSVFTVSVSAAEKLDANTLKADTVTAETKFGTFAITGTDDKAVNIEKMKETRKAKDGTVFNNRIKLNGAGDAKMRSILFSVKKKGKVSVSSNSSSKTEDRVLVLMNKKGDVIAELTAAKEDEANASDASADIPAAGDYVLTSKKGGVNVYRVVVE